MQKQLEDLAKIGTQFTQRHLQIDIDGGYERSEQLHGEVEPRHLAQVNAYRGDIVKIIDVTFEVYQDARQPWFVPSGDSRLFPRLLTREVGCQVVKTGKMGFKNLVRWQA